MLTNVLIVDDEPLAVELLEAYVSVVPGLHIAGKCYNALEAFAVLNKQQVDVIFLDINMPEITGIDFLKMLRDPPLIIFTTAYSEYAAESYNYNVVDYLVKPITRERFMKAVSKLSGVLAPQRSAPKQEDNTLFVRSDGKMIRIDLAELRFIEGYKNYVRLWMEREKVIVHNTMKSFEEYLVSHFDFLRVHKSYIINARYISEISGSSIRMGNETITIGATYKDEVQAALKKYRQL